MILQKIYYETNDGMVFEDEDEAMMHDFELAKSDMRYGCYDKYLNAVDVHNPDTRYIKFGNMTEEQLESLFEYIYDYTDLGFTYEDRSLFKPNSVIFFYYEAGTRENWFTWESSPAKEEFDRLNDLKDTLDKIMLMKWP